MISRILLLVAILFGSARPQVPTEEVAESNLVADAAVQITVEPTPVVDAQEQPTNSIPEPRWTTYYTSTNEYASYLENEFTYQSITPLPDSLKTRLCALFQTDYRNTYNIFKLKTEDENDIYDLIDKVYNTQELFSVFHEYLEILTELEGMGSFIIIHDVAFKKIDVKSYKKNQMTVEAVWSVHGTVRHITHDHEQQNANCVQFKIEIGDENELKISSSKVMSIDRFDLYR